MLQVVVGAVVVGAIFFYFLPRIVDFAEVWATIRAMTWLELTTLLLLAVWNQVTYVLVEMSGRPGLGYRQAVKITQTSTAVNNTLPGGPALGAGLQGAMYRSYGFAPADIAISLTLTGTWNTFAKLAMPIVALALLALLAFATALRSEKGAQTVASRLQALVFSAGRLVGRGPRGDWGAAAAAFRGRVVELLGRQWLQLTSATIVSHVSLYLVLLLALRHVGVPNDSVSWQEALAAFAFVRLLSAIPITPGGLGVVELGLTAALVAAGGQEALLLAAILVYRVLTFVLPLPVGAVSYLFWRRETGHRPRRESLSAR